MNVRALIEQLRTMNPDLPVVVDGYEAGCEDLNEDQIGEVGLIFNYQEPGWEGPHICIWQMFDDGPKCDPPGSHRGRAALLSRSPIADSEAEQ